MALKLVVESKIEKDDGREIALGRGVVKIGRTPAADLRLNDGMFDGELSIEADGEAYLVVNGAKQEVLFVREVEPGKRRADPIGRGERRTWETGVRLKVTPLTALVLVLSSTPGKSSAGWLNRVLTPAVCCAILLVLLTMFFVLIHASLPNPAPPGQILNVPGFANALIRDLDRAATEDEQTWKLLALAVKDARKAEGLGRRRIAAGHYLAARSEATRIRRTKYQGLQSEDPGAELVGRVDRLVNQQLIALRAE